MTHNQEAVQAWLDRFAEALAQPERTDWSTLFVEQSFWRDFVAFSWNIITAEGRDEIGRMARAQARAIGAHDFQLDAPGLPLSDGAQSWFTFKTQAARCRGHVQLEGGRAKVLLTAMLELIGFEEPVGPRRPAGVEHKAAPGRMTWADHREERLQRLGTTEQPYCVIIGGGQNGLQLAARLKRLSVPTLVVDALEKPGDCWRVRYPSLYLHDPIFLDHFPYMPFPDHWPLYTHKEKMADWLEIYAKAMEIDFWGRTVCTSARYDERNGEWHVTLDRDDEEVILRPKQLVLATGLSGAKHVPKIRGADTFAGIQYHSADHRDSRRFAGQNCIVVGSNNSAHDICVELWEAGAKVTMVQRSPTIVVRADTMQQFSQHLPHADPSIPSEFADLISAAMPFRMRYEPETGLTNALKDIDADFYASLEKAGFQLSHGEDETGFLMAYHRRAAGYYIDVGASDLIASGEIALAHGEIAEIASHAMHMANGTTLPADLIVYATGYRPMTEFVARLISPQVAAKVGPCWGLGSDTAGDPGPWEGELRNMWKPTAQEGLWFQAGNLMQARFHSLHLALQIKARMEGLATPVFSITRSGQEQRQAELATAS